MSLIKCNHCHLQFDEKIMIKENELHFCCNGCQNVYGLLKSDGLDSFYEKLGNKTISPPINIENNNVIDFDSVNFYDNFVTKTNEGFCQINLIIEGIHCAACVWLNEKILNNTEGILEANINFTTNKAKIVWNDSTLKLSKIIERIRSIGYNAYAYDTSTQDIIVEKSKQDYFVRIMVAVICTINMMMLSVAKYAGFFTGMTPEVIKMIHIGEFILSTPVLFYSGSIFFKGSYYSIKNKIVTMDLAVCAGATLSYIYSLFVLFGAKGDSYFDSVAMIITFVLVGKYLEIVGKKSAIDTLDKIKSSLPLEAILVENNEKKIIPLNNIKVGDIIEIRAGEKVPVDGEIVFGEGSFDESSLTGESNLIYKKIGDNVISGTINLEALIQFKVKKDFKNSTFSSIITILEESLNSKPNIQVVANKISSGFSFCVLLLSIVTFCVWYYFGLDLGFIYDGANQFERSFIAGVSVIIIACPCALALATPMASLVGISKLTKKGLLFKEAKYIETIALATHVVFDKTGTLTDSNLNVVNVNFLNNDNNNINLLYSLLASTKHPISVSLKKYLQVNFDLKLKKLLNVKSVEAKGMIAQYVNENNEKFELIGGSESFLNDNGIDYKLNSSKSVYLFAINKKVIVTFELDNEIKKGAKELIDYLLNKNIEVTMLTGDNENIASKVAKELNIKNFIANQTPISKANYIKQLKSENKIVIMVGDGLNDSLALSLSDVAIAMGNSSDVSLDVSDIVLLKSDLESLKYAFELSNKTFLHIKQNLYFSLVYNIITIPLAVLGYIIPLIAALSMSLSSLIVVFNSLRIKIKEKEAK